MLGKMSVGVRSAASTPKMRDQQRENDKGVGPPQGDLDDPHVSRLPEERDAAAAPAASRARAPILAQGRESGNCRCCRRPGGHAPRRTDALRLKKCARAWRYAAMPPSLPRRFLPAVAIAALLAVPAPPRAEEQPPLLPTRDVDITYKVTPAARAADQRARALVGRPPISSASTAPTGRPRSSTARRTR